MKWLSVSLKATEYLNRFPFLVMRRSRNRTASVLEVIETRMLQWIVFNKEQKEESSSAECSHTPKISS